MRWTKIKKIWSKQAWERYCSWERYDKKTSQKINKLLKDIEISPSEGLGKPEQLKYEYTGCWSRRIDHKNRLVYKIQDDCIQIISCGSHYEDK